MRKLVLAIMLLTPIHALAGYCNSFGGVTHCYSDNGDVSAIRRIGNTHWQHTDHADGDQTDESYRVYDHNQPSERD